MKITRSPHLSGTGAAGKAPGIAGVKGKPFAEKLAGAARAAGAARGPEKAAAARKARGVSDIGADLAAGRLGPQAALDKVIERVLDRQLGKAAAPALRAQLGAALRESMAEDPQLAAKVRALGRE
jgi:hypothetical protein